MYKKILFKTLFCFSIFFILFLSACKRNWIIEVDGYTLHETNGLYYIAQIPNEVRNQSVYEVPSQIGDYPIYGFGSNRSLGMWAGTEDINFGKIKKVIIKEHIKSISIENYSFLLIETELPVSKIEWKNDVERLNAYFLSPKEDYDIKYVDSSNCYDGLIYEEKEDGFAKIVFNYSDDFIINEKYKDMVVNEISNYSFENSTFKTISIPSNISIINECAFQHSLLEEVTFSDSIKYIGKHAFRDCNLKELNLPNVELEIDNYAFEDNDMSNVVIPENILKIGDGAFYRNSNLNSFTFESKYINHINTYMFSNCPLTGELNFGQYVTSIGNEALSANDREELIIPEGIKSIGKLSECDNLKRIYLPNNKITIKYFNYMDNLEEIHLGGAVNYDTSYNSGELINLKVITTSDDNDSLYVKDGILYNKITNSIIKCPAKLDIEKITINTKPSERAFALNEYIKEVEINSELSERLFIDCSSLEKVILNSNIKEIPAFAFKGCKKLKEINLDNVKKIGDGSFIACESLNYVNLYKCEIVEADAFQSCNLYEVTFTKNIKEIKDDAFLNNKNLKKCNYYDAIVDEYAFYNTPLHVKTDKEKEIDRENLNNILRLIFPWLDMFD